MSQRSKTQEQWWPWGEVTLPGIQRRTWAAAGSSSVADCRSALCRSSSSPSGSGGAAARRRQRRFIHGAGPGSPGSIMKNSDSYWTSLMATGTLVKVWPSDNSAYFPSRDSSFSLSCGRQTEKKKLVTSLSHVQLKSRTQGQKKKQLLEEKYRHQPVGVSVSHLFLFVTNLNDRIIYMESFQQN